MMDDGEEDEGVKARAKDALKVMWTHRMAECARLLALEAYSRLTRHSVSLQYIHMPSHVWNSSLQRQCSAVDWVAWTHVHSI